MYVADKHPVLDVLNNGWKSDYISREEVPPYWKAKYAGAPKSDIMPNTP